MSFVQIAVGCARILWCVLSFFEVQTGHVFANGRLVAEVSVVRCNFEYAWLDLQKSMFVLIL